MSRAGHTILIQGMAVMMKQKKIVPLAGSRETTIKRGVITGAETIDKLFVLPIILDFRPRFHSATA